MDLKTDAPGWVKFNPVDDVNVEIRRLSLEESLDLNAVLESKEETVNGKVELMIILPPDKAKDCFKKYVRNIEGLKVNGIDIKSPAEILDPSMSNLPELQVLYGMCIKKFFGMNVMQEDETKNLNGPSEKNGSAPS